jgi:hypothetical protein
MTKTFFLELESATIWERIVLIVTNGNPPSSSPKR